MNLLIDLSYVAGPFVVDAKAHLRGNNHVFVEEGCAAGSTLHQIDQQDKQGLCCSHRCLT
jgi:hypothetical protein